MNMIVSPPKTGAGLIKEQPRSELGLALRACRGAFLGIGVFTAVSNILMLTGSFFMLEIYDRVLPSRSVPTLIGLATLATLLYLFQGMLDLIRGRVLVRIGKSLDDTLGQRIYRAIVRFPLKARGGGDGLQPLRDLDYVRGFLSGGGPGALFDLPWIPLYLSICFLFHPWIGMWAPARGKVRLDGAALEQWAPEAIGRHIGYLPQNVELFDGTVAENIARFAPDRDAAAVVAAAKAAGVHELILHLPEGYETRIGEGGMSLSAGQRQRIALARALYGDPFLVVLDEPNSNLDIEGDEALSQAILGVRARGGIVVAIAHRPSALAGVDHVLVMSEGRVQAFGPRDEVLSRVLRPQPPLPATPLKVVGDAHGSPR